MSGDEYRNDFRQGQREFYWTLPMYVEPHIITSPFKLNAVDEYRQGAQ